MNLSDPITVVPHVGDVYAKRLTNLDIKTVHDLIYHIPRKYDDLRKITSIAKARVGEKVTIQGTVKSFKNQFTKIGKKIQNVVLTDVSGEIEVIWFNQMFLSRAIKTGDHLSMSGEISFWGKKKALMAPVFEKIPTDGKLLHTGRIVPIYSETKGISSKWLRSRVQSAFENIEKSELIEFLDKDFLDKNNFFNLYGSLLKIHKPETLEETEKSRERLAFDELALLQLSALKKKKKWLKNKVSQKLSVDKKQIEKFMKELSFELTQSQKRSINEIIDDMQKNIPMNRILEGDVGSGKTIVAGVASFLCFLNGKQSIFMAPTQILAQQHFNSLVSLFEKFGIRVELVTSSKKQKALGRSDVFVGTHALLHKASVIEEAALVVIDEQHRFGVEQRLSLIKKTKNGEFAPHVLTMTATPIPRTIVQTLYGDLDLSTLDELPKGRKLIRTWHVPSTKREKSYEWIKKQIIETKGQVFFVCPLIDLSESETMIEVKAAKAEFEKLSKVFREFKLDLLHGRMKNEDKNKILDKFRSNETQILVSTPIVEVGVDIPNATIMVIEGADRFGLAQLHQLRGRIGRGDKQSYCLLFSENESQKAIDRLHAMQSTKSGHDLAEIDLKLRGSGEIMGTKQSGISELKIARWNDFEIIRKSREFAVEVVKTPKKFEKFLDHYKTLAKNN